MTFRNLALVLLASITGHLEAEAASDRPNILVIITDQQSATMMSCAGNQWLKTPAMDSLAATGTRFELAYPGNPVCLPSRFSMFSGYYPSRVGIRHNGDGGKVDASPLAANSMGQVFRRAGYVTAYGGKTHLPRGMGVEAMGFETISRDQRDKLAADAATWLRLKHAPPFLLVLSFINPHDICYMAIRNNDDRNRGPLAPLAEALELPSGVSRDEFFKERCPPLPDNFEPQLDEPQIVETGLFQRAFKKQARDNWSAEQWRLHRWAYCRLTERVDRQIGLVLDALRETGLDRRTLIVFTSDHGDMDAAHRLEHKTMLYDEAARVPLIVSWPGVTKPGNVDNEHLVSTGLDLLPTVCDFANVDPPVDLRGRSVRPLAEGLSVPAWRDDLVIESEFGRALRTLRFKYSIYESGEGREQLIDMTADPGEMDNLATDEKYGDVVRDHRRRLAAHVRANHDEIGRRYIIEEP
jgi:choline-sulfatase